MKTIQKCFRRARLLILSVPVALGLLLGSSISAATAGEILLYSEAIGLDGSPLGTVSNSSHLQAVVYSYSESTSYSSENGIVSFSSSPLPSVAAQTASYNSLGQISASAEGRLIYQIGVHGDAFSRVPIGFRGMYALAGQDLTVDSDEFRGRNTAGIRLVLGDIRSNTQMDILFDYTCGNSLCAEDLKGNIQNIQNTFGAGEISGFFAGGMSVLTGADGYGKFNVSMTALAYSAACCSNFTSNASAFIDPQFWIAPEYLSEHFDAALILPEGVGNGMVTVVPEPNSILLVLVGLIAIGYQLRKVART